MKTKAEIVQRLLEEKQIDAEEAVILLMADDKQAAIIAYPVYPIQPAPVWLNNPWTYPIVTYSNDSNRTYLY